MSDREDLELSRIRNKSSFDQDAARWNNLENESGFEYARLLVTTASILLPLSFGALGTQVSNMAVFQLLSNDQRSIIIIAWISLGMSLLAGSLNLLLDKFNYGRWLDFSLKESNIFATQLDKDPSLAKSQADNMYKKYEALLNKELPKRRRGSGLIIWQSALLWIGVGTLLYIFSQILFLSYNE